MYQHMISLTQDAVPSKPETVRQFGRAHGFEYPDLYVDLVSVNGGRYFKEKYGAHIHYYEKGPNPIVGSDQVSKLMHFGDDDKDIGHIKYNFDLVNEYLPGLVPFAWDYSDDYWCLDFRQDRSEPKVVMFVKWNLPHPNFVEDDEMGAARLLYAEAVNEAADSFREFLEGLQSRRKADKLAERLSAE